VNIGRLIGCLSALILGSGCVGFKGLFPKRGPAYEAELRSWERAVKDRGGNGMWIVIRSYTNAGNLFAITTNSCFSHAALLDAENGVVIESIFVGTVESPLEQLIHNSHRLLLVKPEGWTPETGAAALARARAHLGKSFDHCGLIGFPDPEKWYCSELAMDAWQHPTGRAGPWNVIHPQRLFKLGTIVFDSGVRDGKLD